MNGLKNKQAIFICALVLAVGGVSYLWLRETPEEPGQTSTNQSSPATEETAAKVVRILDPLVSRIIEEGPDMPYLKLNFLIKELPLDLTPQDIDALIAFISGPRPAKFQEAGWGSLVNDIEEILTVQTIPNEKVAHALIAIFRDESKIQMQRDYALQHIGGFAIYLVHTGHLGGDSAADAGLPPSKLVASIFAPLLNEMKTAARQSSKPWSGTAINLLDGLLRAADYRTLEIPGFHAGMLVDLALPIAADPSAPLNARLPALQAATRRDAIEAHQLALEILSSPNPNLMLIQSASATLARLGTVEDLPLLESASDNATQHTALALNEAIRAIQSRSSF